MKPAITSKNLCSIIFAVPLGLLFTSATNAAEQQTNSTHARFDKKGQLIRPSGYREWIFIGAPLTPNDMNDGKAAFPEFHNVYIDPGSWDHWKKTGEFRDGTVIVKELVSVGGKQAPSGNGYFQGDYIGLEAMVKSKHHLPDANGNWGFFRFTIENSPQLHKSASAQPEENCMACHQAKAAKDQMFLQYYPVLRAAAGKGEQGTGR
ncbi:cytochrome P460 family protein [Methylomarinum vadi]|uniref:cytochrome P460 family protein n=1 Tax=Methylomarinum vadi TaxID=438855 RepID=UPI0004DF0304|nr:cytochrome P460 family protein [Methylomarinum vadi]